MPFYGEGLAGQSKPVSSSPLLNKHIPVNPKLNNLISLENQ